MVAVGKRLDIIADQTTPAVHHANSTPTPSHYPRVHKLGVRSNISRRSPSPPSLDWAALTVSNLPSQAPQRPLLYHADREDAVSVSLASIAYRLTSVTYLSRHFQFLQRSVPRNTYPYRASIP